MMPIETAYDRLLEKLFAQSDEVGALSDTSAAVTRDAYLAARVDIQDRMTDLIERRGGLGGLSQGDRFRLTRDTALIENIEGRLADLGVEHQSLVNDYFGQGGTMARGHVLDELADHLDQIRYVQGQEAFVAAVSSSQLDTAAIELGLGRALADTEDLSAALRATVTREIQQGVVAGEGIEQLSRRLDVIPEISTNRAELITRWSTIKGYNLSRQAQYEASMQTIPGLMKQWLTAQDERTCPHCLAHHGEVVSVPAEFDASRSFAPTPVTPYGDLQVPPLHPRCRCTIVAWHEDWRAYTDATPQELEATGRDLAVEQGFTESALGLPGEVGVSSATSIVEKAGAALEGALRGFHAIDDFSGTVRVSGSIDDARLALRNAGFRVRVVDGADDLLRIDLPEGIPLPRMIRSTALRRIPESRWDDLKWRMLRCAK